MILSVSIAFAIYVRRYREVIIMKQRLFSVISENFIADFEIISFELVAIFSELYAYMFGIIG